MDFLESKCDKEQFSVAFLLSVLLSQMYIFFHFKQPASITPDCTFPKHVVRKEEVLVISG